MCENALLIANIFCMGIYFILYILRDIFLGPMDLGICMEMIRHFDPWEGRSFIADF